MLYLLSFDWQKAFVFAHQTCQKHKMAKICLLNNLNELLNLMWLLWHENCLFCRLNRQISNCTFLYLLISRFISFFLYFSYLQKFKAILHAILYRLNMWYGEKRNKSNPMGRHLFIITTLHRPRRCHWHGRDRCRHRRSRCRRWCLMFRNSVQNSRECRWSRRRRSCERCRLLYWASFHRHW